MNELDQNTSGTCQPKEAQQKAIRQMAEEAKMTEPEIIHRALMEECARREPTPFIQYDAFLNGTTDDNEYYLSSTLELMGGADVQVFIQPTTKPEDVIRALRMFINWIEQDGIQYDNNTASSIVSRRRAAQVWDAQPHEDDDLFD